LHGVGQLGRVATIVGKLSSDRVCVVHIHLDRLEKLPKVGELHYVLKSKAILHVDLCNPKVIFQRLVDEAFLVFGEFEYEGALSLGHLLINHGASQKKHLLSAPNGDNCSHSEDLFVLCGARISKAHPMFCFIFPLMQ
jgi:hypothetical protein